MFKALKKQMKNSNDNFLIIFLSFSFCVQNYVKVSKLTKKYKKISFMACKPFLFQFYHITPTGGGIFTSEIMFDGIGKDFCLTITIFLRILLGTKDYCFCAV